MDFLTSVLDFFSYLEKHLETLFFHHGQLTYVVLFLVIFCETAFLVTSFLPGDSLLLAAGLFAAGGSLDITVLLVTLSLATVSGTLCSYWLGTVIGRGALQNRKSRLLNHDNLLKAHRFYEKYGPFTLLISQFVAFIRSFVPFVAGIARMDFRHFLAFDIIGSVVWVCVFCLGGMFFGKIPFFEENTLFAVFLFVLMTLVVIPLLFLLVRKLTRKDKPAGK